MEVLNVENVSIRYMTGDFKDIGLKEYVMRRLKKNYQVTEFWADKNITFSLEQGAEQIPNYRRRHRRRSIRQLATIAAVIFYRLSRCRVPDHSYRIDFYR